MHLTGPRLLCFLCVLVLGVGGGGIEAQAQGIDRVGTDPYEVVYRPDTVSYRVHRGDRFDLIYQAGAADMAWRTGRALNTSWAKTDSLVGPVVDDVHMPVVINNYTDRSNGIVDPVPFRQEIEAPSIKSNPLTAHASTWPAIVAPHEAVHAAHAEVQGGGGVGALLRPFAPDAARALNLTAPAGLIEGAAVYRESQLEPGSGRLHAPLFTMKMKAAMLSEDPWSLTQMWAPPAYTQPFNRYYIGGGHVFQYLATRGETESTEFFGSMVDAHNRIPILGHGVWLARATGQRPGELRDEMRSDLQAKYQAELDRHAPFTDARLIAGTPGRTHRRPYWLSDSTLVAYVHGYATRPGFYRIDASSGERTPIRIQSVTEDRAFSLSPDTTALYASRYVQRPTVPSQQMAEVERISLSDGSATRLTEQGRAFVPAEDAEGTLYAAVNDGPFSRLAKVTPSGSTRALTPPAPLRIRQIAPSPTDERIAVLVHKNGDQRLYRARAPIDSLSTLRPWVDVVEGVIYDVSWGPSGRYLLFAAEQGRAANVYARDTHTGRTLQLTNVRFGALEPALSPDQSTLAFVRYRHEQHDLVRMPFRPDSASTVPDSLVRGDGVALDLQQVRSGDPPSDPRRAFADRSRSYASGRHLTPRMLYPTLQGADGEAWDGGDLDREPLGVGVGLGVAGSDPLQQWAYKARAWWQDGRLWGEAKVQTGEFLLRPSLSAYNRPFGAGLRVTPDEIVPTAVEERGVNLGVEVPIALQSNVYRSALQVRVDAEARQTRLIGPSVSLPSPFVSRFTLTPELVFAYRLQQNQRDVVPNTGLVLQADGVYDAWTSEGAGTVATRVGADVYLPYLRRQHTGIRLGAELLTQQEGAVFDASSFVPRGTNISLLPGGTFLELEAEVTQPLWYIDDGLSLVPLYAKALSVYGFGESMGEIHNRRWQEVRTSVGGGIRFQARLFYALDLDLRIGAAYQVGLDEFEWIGR